MFVVIFCCVLLSFPNVFRCLSVFLRYRRRYIYCNADETPYHLRYVQYVTSPAKLEWFRIRNHRLRMFHLRNMTAVSYVIHIHRIRNVVIVHLRYMFCFAGDTCAFHRRYVGRCLRCIAYEKYCFTFTGVTDRFRRRYICSTLRC